MSHPWCRHVVLYTVVHLLLICCAVQRIHSITVPLEPGSVEVTTTVPTITNSQPRAAEKTTLSSSFQMACSSEKPFLFERSSNSLKLYLLDAAGLHRFENEESTGMVKSHISTLPKGYEEAITLQILDIKLGDADYVLFIVTTDQWHNVFLSYQNVGAGPASAQPVQRIKYSGNFSKAQLLECNGKIYMVTIVTYANTGKIRVYRWQQSYFSLESTKEVLSIDDVRCHCPSTLLLLALDYGQLPERSLNHVLLLDSAEKPVKVQEMFFMYSSLPSFTLDNELFLIRHVSRDKSYLYQWSTEARFVRLRKLSQHPEQITTYTHWGGTLAVAFEDTIRLYSSNKQNLLRVETPFSLHGSNSSEPLTQLTPGTAGEKLKMLYGLRAADSGEVILATEFYCPPPTDHFTNSTALHIYKLSTKQGFQTLNSCLHRLKQELNERKKWIDLIRLQLSQKNLLFDAITQSDPTKSTLLHPSVTLDSVLLPHSNPHLLPPSRTILNGQSLLLRHYRVATDLNQVLLLNRERTEIRGDLHVTGNVHTRCSKIRAVNAQDSFGADAKTRRMRSTVRVAGKTSYRVVKAKEIVSDSTLSKRCLLRSKMNVVHGTMQLDELNTQSVRVEQGSINHITIPTRKVLMDVVKHGYRGHKIFRNVKSFRLNTHHLNGQPLSTDIIESGLKYANDGITIKTDVCRARNLVIRNTVNDFALRQLVFLHQHTLHIKGNLRLGEQVCVKNLQYHRTMNNIPKEEFLDRFSNQTITGPVFVSKGFTHNLQVRQVNGELLANYATTSQPSRDGALQTLQIQAPVRAEKMIVLGDLTANHEDQQLTRHIGTSPGDFRQLYTGKVVLNGTLRLKVANINVPNITIMGQSVTSKPYQQYLLRTERQIINHPIAYPTAQFQYLFANTLRGVALWQFSLTHRNWQNSFYLQDVAVQGNVRPARIAKRLHSMQQNRIDVNAHIRLCDVKHFAGTLRVAHLHTQSIDGTIIPEALWRKDIQYGSASAASKILLGRTELRQSVVQIQGPFHTAEFNGRTAYDIEELAKPPPRRYHTMRLSDVNATMASVQQVADLSLDEVLQRFVTTPHQHHGTSLGSVPSFAKIVTPVYAQQIPVVSVGQINFCPVQRLLQETVSKHSRPGRTIAGYKQVLGTVTIPKRLTVTKINDHETEHLGRIVTRGPDALPQSIDTRWRFGTVSTGYLTAKLINRTPLTRLALRSEETLLLQGELLIERLQVNVLQLPKHPVWIFEPNTGSSLLHIPHGIARLHCYGSVHSHIRDPTHLLNQLLLTPSLDQTRTVTSGLVFAGPSVHFGNCTALAGGAIQRIERTARRCLRRNTSPTLRLPVVFEQDQVLLQTGPELMSMRGNLKVAESGQLKAHTIAGVNVAERLGPTADIYRLLTHDPAKMPIVGEKRFTQESKATVHNVTLVPGSTGGSFWSRLAFCNHPTQYACTGSLHFEQSVMVSELLVVGQLNNVPLEGFFHAFVKRQSAPLQQSKLHQIQDLPGTLTVSELRLTGTGTILNYINSIPLGELIFHSTTNATHQIVPGAKTFRALHIDGPLSLQHLNRRPLSQMKRDSLSSDDVHQLEMVVFSKPVLMSALHTRLLYHSRTASYRLVGENPTIQLPSELHLRSEHLRPLMIMQRSNNVGRSRTNSVTIRSQESNSFTEVVTVDGGEIVRLHCSPDLRSLIVELRRIPMNRTSEQRLHELPPGTGCLQPLDAYNVNRTTLLILLRHKNTAEVQQRVATTSALYQYDLVRGHLTAVKIPNPGPTCRHTRLLRPTVEEIMLATAGCSDSAVSSGIKLYQLDTDGTSLRLRHFQTIELITAISAMGATVDGTTLLIKDDGTHWHRYTYSSVQRPAKPHTPKRKFVFVLQ
uniref:VWFD domain-containing protein n=1 Tax=Anopheles minimus TaxID=112268 RepID=A0A182W5E6_9DIPT